jgi:hypothetical protein
VGGIGERDDWDQVRAIGRGYGVDGAVYHDAGRLIAAHTRSHIATGSRALAVPYKTCAAPPPNWKRNRCTRTDGSIQGISYKGIDTPRQRGRRFTRTCPRPIANKIRLHFFLAGESGARHRKNHPRGESGRARIGCPVHSGGGSENGESNISITNRPVHSSQPIGLIDQIESLFPPHTPTLKSSDLPIACE